MPTQACHGLGCVPSPWLPAPGGYLGHDCLPMGATLALVVYLGHGCLPWGLPRPWLRALALAACLWGSVGCFKPRPWQLARGGLPWSCLHAVSLDADCQHMWSDFLKVRDFVKMRLFPPRRQAWDIRGHAHIHTTPRRPASSRTPAKLARAFVHYCVPKFNPSLYSKFPTSGSEIRAVLNFL